MPGQIDAIPEKQIISMITPEGEEIEAEVLLHFSLKTTNKKYLIYTHNETTKNDMVTVYAAACKEVGNDVQLENIETNDEWDLIKEVMRSVIKNGGVDNK